MSADDAVTGQQRFVATVDSRAWENPFLTGENLARFHRYSMAVWDRAQSIAGIDTKVLRCAFSVNMAQNMYGWAQVMVHHGIDATLYPHPMDFTALNAPEWEEFDGAYGDIFDGAGFLAAHPEISLKVPVKRVVLEGSTLLGAHIARSRNSDLVGNWTWANFEARSAGMRLAYLLAHDGCYPYFSWARELATHEVVLSAGWPIAAHASGKPHFVLPVGGEFEHDCGRSDAFGAAMREAMAGAEAVFVTNPHTLAHARRLGLRNCLYLPFLLDTERYSPSTGRARAEWSAALGDGVFVLMTSRVDRRVKGQGPELTQALVECASRNPQLRFVFLSWGSDASEFSTMIENAGLSNRVLMLPAVGKRQLLDYYRSCDVVLDQLVWGYLGSTALEAAAVGKPVIMRCRREQYEELSGGDPPAVVGIETFAELAETVLELAADVELRKRTGRLAREWAVRLHGPQRIAPILRALLKCAIVGANLDVDEPNPLDDPLTGDEVAYHHSRRVVHL